MNRRNGGTEHRGISNLSPQVSHGECNDVPGILERFEYGDLLALVAPRPLCVINGAQDIIFPVEAARSQFATIAGVYRALGAEDRCRHYIHPHGHRHEVQGAVELMRKWMG